MPITGIRNSNMPQLGLIGLGAWGRRYLQAVESLNAAIAVCHTRNRGADAAWLAAHHPGVRHTTSLDAALDGGLDAAVIATPRPTHAALTTACLRRGLPVLVEKPAVTTLTDLERTHAEARARGLVLRTGYTHRFDATARELAGLARRAAAPRWRLTWAKPAPGTGVRELIWEYFPHVISLAELLGGVDADRMGAVRLRATPGPSGTATVAVDLPLRAGRGRAEVSSAAATRHKEIRLYDGATPVAVWTDRRLRDLRTGRVAEAREPPLVAQLRAFLDAASRPGGPHPLDRTVTRSLAALDAAARSETR